MFNVLISGNSISWETDQYMHMDKKRFGEHSGTEIQTVKLEQPETFKLLEDARALLLYESGASGDTARVVRIGHVHDISVGHKDIRFRFAETGRLPRDVIEELGHFLDIDSWELNRTHWAVKDGDIPKAVLDKVLQTFDVFLCHNSRDKPAVIQLGTALKDRGLRVWLDEWEIPPGRRWQDALEEIVGTCKSAAVCVGGNGIGPWADIEIGSLLSRFVNERKKGNLIPIIPTLLPDAPDAVELPPFLQEFTWVKLKGGLTEQNLCRLEWGITGVKPVRLT